MSDNFRKYGFDIIESKYIEELKIIRDEICTLITNIFDLPDKVESSILLNQFHKFISDLSLGDLNSKRVDLINAINSKLNINRRIFKIFKSEIESQIGPDILIQKGCNLVLQMPSDPNPSELHRDAPPNSLYELVLWVPLVDAYKTKSMYLLDKDQSLRAKSKIEEFSDWSEYELHCRESAKSINVPFGNALIFHAGLLHGSDINIENETRVSLNLRFKNIFSPQGLKNQLQFFEILQTSDLTDLALEQEKKLILK